MRGEGGKGTSPDQTGQSALAPKLTFRREDVYPAASSARRRSHPGMLFISSFFLQKLLRIGGRKSTPLLHTYVKASEQVARFPQKSKFP